MLNLTNLFSKQLYFPPNMKIWFSFLASLLIPFIIFSASAAETKNGDSSSPRSKRPNVVVIVSDDGGWADFGFNNCKDFKTPALDALANQGVVFNNGYVTGSVCSPSRAGLLIGKMQTRFGHEHNILPGSGAGMSQKEKTLADRLKAAGYATAAFGKWHLGAPEGYRPSERGFDYSYTFLAGSRGYYPDQKETDSERTLRRNNVPEKLTEYISDAIGNDAATFIKKAPAGKPLFMYVAFNCPHSPMQAKEGYEDRFSSLTDKKRRTLAAMQTSLDENVGKIVQALKDRGELDNTLIWFVNDNGAGTYWAFDNGTLRGNKGSLFDGGIKVAFFATWPKGGITTGKRMEHPMSSLDISATSLAAAGLPSAPELEGVNLLPYLKTPETTYPNRTLCWRQGNIGAIQSGGWKLIQADQKPLLLVDLKKDPGEKINLAISSPEKAKELLSLWNEWDKKNVEPHWRKDYRANGDQYLADASASKNSKAGSSKNKKGKKNKTVSNDENE